MYLAMFWLIETPKNKWNFCMILRLRPSSTSRGNTSYYIDAWHVQACALTVLYVQYSPWIVVLYTHNICLVISVSISKVRFSQLQYYILVNDLIKNRNHIATCISSCWSSMYCIRKRKIIFQDVNNFKGTAKTSGTKMSQLLYYRLSRT